MQLCTSTIDLAHQACVRATLDDCSFAADRTPACAPHWLYGDRSSGQVPPFVIMGLDHAGAQRSFEYTPYKPGIGPRELVGWLSLVAELVG